MKKRIRKPPPIPTKGKVCSYCVSHIANSQIRTPGGKRWMCDPCIAKRKQSGFKIAIVFTVPVPLEKAASTA